VVETFQVHHNETVHLPLFLKRSTSFCGMVVEHCVSYGVANDMLLLVQIPIVVSLSNSLGQIVLYIFAYHL